MSATTKRDTDLKDLIARIERAKDVSEFRITSRELITFIQKTHCFDIFLSNYYDDFTYNLLNHILVLYASSMSPKELDESRFFFSSGFFPATPIFLILSASLESVQDQIVIEFIIQQLTLLFDKDDVCSIDLLQKISLNKLDDTIINRVGSLPDRMLNALARKDPKAKLPSTFQPDVLFGSFLRTALRVILQDVSDPKSVMSDATSRVISKFCRLGFATLVAEISLSFLVRTKNQSNAFLMLQNVLISTSTTALENLFATIISRMTTTTSLTPLTAKCLLWDLIKECLLTAKTANQRFVKTLFTYKFFLTKTFSRRVLELLVGVLAESPQLVLVKDVLALTSKVWAEPAFVRQSSAQQHAYITRAIILCVNTVAKAEGKGASGGFSSLASLPHLMEGVQVRLSSSILDIRKQGMRVATAFSVALEPTEPLVFDELKDDEAWGRDEAQDVLLTPLDATETAGQPEVMSSTNNNDNKEEDDEEEEEDPNKPFVKKTMNWDQQMDDLVNEPSAEEKKGGHEGANSDDDNDEEDEGLVAYDLAEDDEDLRKVPLPMFPQQCLEYFRKTDDRDKVEAGLESLEGIIKAIRVDDLPADLAMNLMKALHQIGTAGWVDETEWERLRIRGMVALLCKCPFLMGPHLASQFYAQNRGLKDRMDCLDVLVMGAQELASTRESPLEKNNITPPVSAVYPNQLEYAYSFNNQITQVSDVQDKAAIVQARVEKNTIRRKHVDMQQLARPHGFGAEVAEAFFFPLIRAAEVSVVQVISSEPFLVGRLLHALTAFVECAGASGGSMAKELRRLLWFSRVHEEAVVRRASLYGLSRILGLKLLDVQDSLEDITNWVVEARADPDAECRQLALVCLVSLESLVGASQKLLDARDADWSFTIPSSSTLTMHL